MVESVVISSNLNSPSLSHSHLDVNSTPFLCVSPGGSSPSDCGQIAIDEVSDGCAVD